MNDRHAIVRVGFALACAAILTSGCVLDLQMEREGVHVFFVSPQGDDAWTGLQPDPTANGQDGPFATLEGARDAIRRLKRSGRYNRCGATVYVRGGIYARTDSFELTPEDSGARGSEIVYRNYGDEEVRLSGGRAIAGFTRVTDPAILRRVDTGAHESLLQSTLPEHGVTDYGKLKTRGFGKPILPSELEFFFGGRPMTLARWPNDAMVETGEVIDDGKPDAAADKPARGGRFVYEGDRPNRWAQADDLWLFGYWFYDWADQYIRIQSIDTQKKEIALVQPHGYGIGKGKPYYALNLLEEIDSPGEWYLDRKTGILYFWPPSPVEESEAYVSVLEEPMLILREASHIRFEGMTLELARGTGVKIHGGSNNVVAGCTIRNLGANAGNIDGGTRNGFLSCDIEQIGEGGITIRAGDRTKLVPAENYAENNDIRDYSRTAKTYRGAVNLYGVGNRASHNRIHEAPHSAMFYQGNDHIIEFNEVANVCTATGDGGSVYTGRDWNARGTVIRYNLFYKIRSHLEQWENAVYLDDLASGITVFGNIFYDCHWGMLVGGGRDNTVENNFFINCNLAIHFDARGLGWYQKHLGVNDTISVRLREMPYKRKPWSERYPQLVGILDDEPATPKGNVLRDNVVYTCKEWLVSPKEARAASLFENNLITDENPGFVDLEAMDFGFRPGSPLDVGPFERIPFESIGLVKDRYRRTLPKP